VRYWGLWQSLGYVTITTIVNRAVMKKKNQMFDPPLISANVSPPPPFPVLKTKLNTLKVAC